MVDDSSLCQKILVKVLQKIGIEVDLANNGQEAIELLRIPPCGYLAVFMDLRMPVMDGVTATRKCREFSHLQRLPIIALSAELGKEVEDEVMGAGATTFMSKPVRHDDIVTALCRIASI